MRDGEILFRGAYGLANMELHVPMEPHMVFRIASLAKQFTATGILILLERDPISLDDDIRKYLPDYPTHWPMESRRTTASEWGSANSTDI